MQGRNLKETSQFPAFRLRVAAQMADYRQRLAERLEHERTRKSLSQDSLALMAGVSPKTIKRIEEGKVDNPRPVTIRRLAEALGVGPAELRPPDELEQDQLNRIEAKLDQIRESLSLPDLDLDEVADDLAREVVEQEPPMSSETAPPGRAEEKRTRAAS